MPSTAQPAAAQVESWIENGGPFGNTWVILTPIGNGKYRYQQLGGASASGTADRRGNFFRIDWSTAAGEAGYQDFVYLDLMSTEGQGHFTRGSRAGLTYRIMMYPDPYVGSFTDENGIYGSTTFTLTGLGGGNYTYRQIGSFNAVGSAALKSEKLRIDWTGTAGAAGYIEYEVVGGRLTGKGIWVIQKGRPATFRSSIRKNDTRAQAGQGSQTFEASGSARWNRTWTTDWGDMTFQANGSRVTGTFTHKDGKIDGDLSADGKVITGRWTQNPTRTAPNDAGALELTLADDGRSFSGRWWYGFDKSQNANGGWHGSAK